MNLNQIAQKITNDKRTITKKISLKSKLGKSKRRLSPETQLMEERRSMQHDVPGYRDLTKIFPGKLERS